MKLTEVESWDLLGCSAGFREVCGMRQAPRVEPYLK